MHTQGAGDPPGASGEYKAARLDDGGAASARCEHDAAGPPMRDSAAKNMGKQFDEAIQFGALYKALKKCCRGVRWKPSTAGYEHLSLIHI